MKEPNQQTILLLTKAVRRFVEIHPDADLTEEGLQYLCEMMVVHLSKGDIDLCHIDAVHQNQYARLEFTVYYDPRHRFFRWRLIDDMVKLKALYSR